MSDELKNHHYNGNNASNDSNFKREKVKNEQSYLPWCRGKKKLKCLNEETTYSKITLIFS